MTLPDHIGRLAVLNTPGTREAAAQLVKNLRANGSQSPVAKVYSTDHLTTSASAIITDVPASVRDPHLANVVSGFTASFTAGTRVAKPVAMPPGPKGGYLVCGLRPATATGESAAYCVWTDGPTLSEVSLYRSTEAAAYALAMTVRSATGH